MELFPETLNTTDYHLFFGDFNSEILAPSGTLPYIGTPVNIQDCTVRTPRMSSAHVSDARRNVKALTQFPLHILSTF